MEKKNMTGKKTDILLISMPYADIFRPSLALGNLQAILTRADFSVESIYANALFAEFYFDRFGKDGWQFITQSRVLELLGEWSFSHLLFPAHRDEVDSFIELLRRRHWLYREYTPECMFRYLTQARLATEEFTEHLLEKIIARSPRIVGCSSTFEQHCASLVLFKRIKERCPEIITVMGGANCESVMGLTTHQQFPWVDYVASGEGDELIVPLVRLIMDEEAETSAEQLPYGVFGPIHRETGYPLESEKETVVPRAVVAELDSLPVPDFDDYYRLLDDSAFLKRLIRPSLLLESSRGCWWGQKNGCTFCGLNGCGNSYRFKSPQTVIHHLDSLARRYGRQNFAMTDNIFAPTYFKTLLPQLRERKAPYRIFYETKANLTQNQVKAFAESGMNWIQPGIESLSTPFLKLMNKGCKAWQNLQTLKWCRQYGVRIQWFILWDFPQDRDEWYQEMADLVPLITHFQPPVAMLAMIINRFSYYHDNAAEIGLEISPAEPYSSIYKLPQEVITNLAYFFEDHTREKIKQDSFMSSLLNREGVAALRKELASWIVPFNKGEDVMLSMEVTADIIRIRDKRPAALKANYELKGMTRELYLASDDACPLEDIWKLLATSTAARKEFDESLNFLLEHRLLVQIDDRLLALALKNPVTRLLDYSDWPGGSLKDAFRSRPAQV